uniref:Wsv327-like protein n=1 Tax=Metopaulias depressus WSSV-like virus TaxID=1675544 RepID=A0A0K0VLN1_9VIRU|nr:wsv327-like protein [Metopaulias depressus WSSV-like virus]
MTAHNACVLALVAESKRDAVAREYVSEGLYATARVLNSDQDNAPRVLSSDILGLTWFSKNQQQFTAGISTGRGPVTKRSFDQAVIDGDILSLDEMMSRVIDPSWRLSERAAEELTDFGFLKQAPILNLLNGFEYMMYNVFRSAADLVVSSSSGPPNKRPTCLVDSSMLLKNESSTADVAVGRARRVVALFSYTLIDILKWKKAVSERLQNRGLPPFPSIPLHAPYDHLIQLITERGTKFIEGLIEEDVCADTLVPSVTAVLAAAVASAEDGFFPRISGTFYESILGYKIMSMLSVLISAEYGALISRIKRVGNTVHGHLERYVLDPEIEIPSERVTEEEKRWIRVERERRDGLKDWEREVETAFKQHEYLGAAIDLEPTAYNDDVAIKALHREVTRTMKEHSITSPAAAVARVCSISIRQPLFSNFSIMRVRSRDSAARFSMYAIWNTLFLATGGLTSSIAETNSVRSRLLLNFFLKDLHALFSCTRCEYGFMLKTLDTFSMWEEEKSNDGEGDEELRKVLAAALQSLTATMGPQNNTTKTVGQLVHDILAYINPGDELNTAALAVTGKMRIQKLDNDVRELYTSDRREYAVQGSSYVSVSKGFAALAFYLLYSSAATAPRLPTNAATLLDRAVILLLGRWGSLRFPTHNLWRGGINDKTSFPLLAFASIWALRNAVRARRYVDDPSNITFVPGRPLTILEELSSVKNLTAVLNNNYILSENIDSQKLVWKAIEELETESEVWASDSNKNVRRARRDMDFSSVKRSELVKEPAGLVPTTTSYTVSNVLFPRKRKILSHLGEVDKNKSHLPATVGHISL